MWGFVCRRGLRRGASGRRRPAAHARSFLLEGKSFVHEEALSPALDSQCCVRRSCSSSTAEKYTFAWGQPFEEGVREETESAAAAGEGEGDGETKGPVAVAGQTGRLGRLLIRLSPDAPVTPVLQQWLEESNPLPKNVVIVALTNLKRHRRYKQALEVANYVWSESLFEMDDVDHMYRLYLTGQIGSIADVEKCFAEVPFKWSTELVYNQLMSCYIARGMVSQAENALEKLKNSGHPVSALPFSQFLSLYSHQRQFDKAFELMREMTAANIIPDTRTYNILMSLTQKQGDTDKVLRFYQAMKDAGVAPDSFTYSLVTKAYMSAGMEHEAQSLRDEMMKRSPEEGHLAQDLMLAVYADQGNEKELRKLWNQVQSSSNLSARSYGVMIESLGKLGLIEEAEHLATKAERKRGRLVARIFNAMMDVYARHGKMQAAEELMVRIIKDRLRPNTVTYRHLIAGYLKVGQVDKALEYLRTSRESLSYDHSKPWLVSFMLVLENMAERGEVELAEQTFETFTAAGRYRSTLVYNTLLKTYARAKNPAPNFIQRMHNDGLEPDAETLTLLADIKSSSGFSSKAVLS